LNDEPSTTGASVRFFRALRAAMGVCLALVLFAVAATIASRALTRMEALARGDSAAGEGRPSDPAQSGPDWQQVGVSVQGRPILMASFGSGQRRVLVIGGVHGSEFGADVAEQFAAWLSENPEAVPSGTRVDVVACANPDGRAAGKKGNADGVNLNGNFPTRNWKRQKYLTTTAGPRAGSEPETQAIMRLLGTGYVRVISLHSQGGFIDYDGPDGRALASQVASASGWPVKKLGPSGLYAGSLGTYVPERFGIPVLTVELSSRELTPGVLAGLEAALR
jgi:murein peptide amidase A